MLKGVALAAPLLTITTHEDLPMRVLISACRSTNSMQANSAAMMSLAKYLVEQGHQFEVAVGCYPEEGQAISTESTYVVHVNTEGWAMDAVDALAQSWAQYANTEHQQDCVGIVFDGAFYLAWPNAPLEHVGPFRQVPTQPKGKPCTFYRGQWYLAEGEAA